jgi:hypothetical protein
VLLEAARYDDFAHDLGADFDEVLAGAARQAGLQAETLRETARASEVGLVSLNGDTLLLPGPYRSCATQRLPITSR